MALKTVDLTQQPHRATFTGCSQEEVSYAKTFWQSLQLMPPMESRLVSSDIKQRLRKAPPSRSMSESDRLLEGGNAANNILNTRSSSFSLALSDTAALPKFDKIHPKLSKVSDSEKLLECSAATDSLNKQSSDLSIFSDSAALYKFDRIPLHSRSCKQSGSLHTQTSLISNFGQSLEMDSKSRQSQNKEGQHETFRPRKISVSSGSAGSSIPEAETGKKCMLGAGGREFWSRGDQGKLECDLTRTIEPFSGEDLCRRKGFINWGEQNVLAKHARNIATAVECGGEELRGNRNVQPSKRTPKIVVNHPLAVSTTADYHNYESNTQEETFLPYSCVDRQTKKQQRLVSSRQVVSTFQSGNLDLEKNAGNSFACTSSKLVKYFFRPMLIALPDSFTRHIPPPPPTERDPAVGNDNTTTLENHNNVRPLPVEKKSIKMPQVRKKKKREGVAGSGSLNKASAKSRPSSRREKPAAVQGKGFSSFGDADDKDGLSGKALPFVRPPHGPPEMDSPSKDVVYWTP